jgi:predicted ATPase
MQGEVDPGQSAEDLAVAARSSDSPLIGRDSEVEVLRRLISESGGGDGARVCVLTGEAGVGKSRLLREAARVGAGLGCTILFGEAHEYDNAIAYSAVNDAITSLDTTGLAADVRRHRAAVLDVTGAGRPESNPREVTARLLDLARCVLSRGPLLVILDDAHLADDSSLTVWSLMARYLRTEALTMVTGVKLESGRRAPASPRPWAGSLSRCQARCCPLTR